MDQPQPGQIAGTVAALALSYTLRATGSDGLGEILRRIGPTTVREIVGQPDLWIDYGRARRVVDAAADITGATDVGYRLGEEAARVLEEQGRLQAFRDRGFEEVIGVMSTVLTDASAQRRMGEIQIDGDTASMEAVATEHPDDRLLCRLVVGFLTALPAYLGRTGIARETRCVTEGAPTCRFEVDWRPGPSAQSIVALTSTATSARSGLAGRASEMADALDEIIDGLVLPHHVRGVEAFLSVGAHELVSRRGTLDVAGSTRFQAPVTGVTGTTGSITIAFAGRGLPAIDQHLVTSCAATIADAWGELSEQSSLQERARTDPLTGLVNRAHLEELTATIDDGTAVVFVDLDRFKEVNDTLGHGAGDALLAQVGDRLRRAVRSSDVVARVGGDEFVALLAGTASLADAEAVAAKLVTSLDAAFTLGDSEVEVSGSWGVARAPDDGAIFADLVARADQRMYATKRRDRSGPAGEPRAEG